MISLNCFSNDFVQCKSFESSIILHFLFIIIRSSFKHSLVAIEKICLHAKPIVIENAQLNINLILKILIFLVFSLLTLLTTKFSHNDIAL